MGCLGGVVAQSGEGGAPLAALVCQSQQVVAADVVVMQRCRPTL